MKLWLARKLILQKRVFREPTTIFALAGIALGVAFLVVVMAGFSGFAQTLKQTIVDVSGDIVVYKQGGGRIADAEAFEAELRSIVPSIDEVLPYSRINSIVAKNGKLSSVFLNGMDWDQSGKVLDLDSKVISRFQGEVSEGMGQPSYIGTEIGLKLALKIGDSYRAIVLNPSETSATGISPLSEKFFVAGIVDFGKYEFNERFIVTDLKVVQKMARMKNAVNGFNIKLNDSSQAVALAGVLQNELGWDYGLVDWTKVHKSLFAAIEYEKMVLFFIMLIMVIASFFNVSTTLFLNVLRRYSQVSVLKTLGLKRIDIVYMFCLNGLLLGVVGLGIGLGLGLIFCGLFEWVQKIYPIMPADVYVVTFVTTDLRWEDLGMISCATIVICLISTLAPAFRGARLSPVEGLKYE